MAWFPVILLPHIFLDDLPSRIDKPSLLMQTSASIIWISLIPKDQQNQNISTP